jgi:hypothetical protein
LYVEFKLTKGKDRSGLLWVSEENNNIQQGVNLGYVKKKKKK